MKKQKSKPKTIEELTKGFEELAKREGYVTPSKPAFEKNVKKISSGSKDSRK